MAVIEVINQKNDATCISSRRGMARRAKKHSSKRRRQQAQSEIAEQLDDGILAEPLHMYSEQREQEMWYAEDMEQFYSDYFESDDFREAVEEIRESFGVKIELYDPDDDLYDHQHGPDDLYDSDDLYDPLDDLYDDSYNDSESTTTYGGRSYPHEPALESDKERQLRQQFELYSDKFDRQLTWSYKERNYWWDYDISEEVEVFLEEYTIAEINPGLEYLDGDADATLQDEDWIE